MASEDTNLKTLISTHQSLFNVLLDQTEGVYCIASIYPSIKKNDFSLILNDAQEINKLYENTRVERVSKNYKDFVAFLPISLNSNLALPFYKGVDASQFDHCAWAKDIKTLLTTGYLLKQISGKSASQKPIWLEFHLTCLADSQENIEGIFTTVLDITAKKNQDILLRKVQEQSLFFFNKALEGFYIAFLEKGKIIEWPPKSPHHREEVLVNALKDLKLIQANPALLAQYGLKSDEIDNFLIADIFKDREEQGTSSTVEAPSLFEFFFNHIEESLRILNHLYDHGRYSAEIIRYRKNGEPFYIEGEYLCIYDDDYHIIGHIATQRDITARKQLEQYLAQAAIEAEKANQAKSILIAHINEELRLPLNQMIKEISHLLKSKVDANQIEYLLDIQFATEQLMVVINDLMDIAQMECGKMTLHLVDFDLYALLNRLPRMIRPRLYNKNVKFHMDIHENLPQYIRSDPLRLYQILMNLLGNAAKFTHQGEIKLIVKTVEKENSSGVALYFEVMDTGMGIPEDKLTQIFEAFTQANHHIAHQYGGTGLGLTISANLAKQLKGYLTVKSQVGQGSRFFFKIDCLIGSPTSDDFLLAWLNKIPLSKDCLCGA